jgi:hypothetical protein
MTGEKTRLNTFLFYKHIFGKSMYFQRIAHMASFDYHGFITLGRKDLVSFQSKNNYLIRIVKCGNCKSFIADYLHARVIVN